MAELVTGHAGKAHATAEQAAGLNAGILGLDDYVLNVHDKFKLTVVSANKVTIGTGELVMQGRHVSKHARGPDRHQRVAGSETQRPDRMPLCEGSQNIESAKLVVVRGTPTTGTPTDPAVNTTSPLDGGTTYDMPLYRIPLDGITIGAPVALFNVLKPMSDVWDSLTQRSTTWRVPYSNNSISLTRVGDICFAGGNVKFNQNGENNYTQRGRPYPVGYRPAETSNVPIAVFGGNTTFILYGEHTGRVVMLGNPNSAYAGCTGVWRTADPMPAA